MATPTASAQQVDPGRGRNVPAYAQNTNPSSNGNGAAARNQTDPRALQIQQTGGDRVGGNPVGGKQTAEVQQTAGQGAANATATGANPNAAPFAPLNPTELDRLQKLLQAWETQSKGTKTMTCKFQKWHFDLLAAPAGIHATKSTGEIKYATPDKGMFREDQVLFYQGMKDGKPQYGAQQGKVGDYWVCNGREVIEFDGNEKKCTINELPAGMQGQQIFNSPLPFVFNLDAKQIQERYWVREVKAPKEGMFLIEAWPKQQSDRAQYRLVQIALDDQQFLPQALIMYAPNFNAKTAPMWDHYEFADVKRNAIRDGMQQFFKNFIPQRPPSDWEVIREKLAHEPDASQIASPGQPNLK
ncbi:MAG: TIGR03009 domain-containing protein [Pirellulaceae bacterium]|nr:TIGR03009 domain-containing protein [Pirellulaceae bacterium]